MSAHQPSNNVQALYEGDQSKLYSGVLSHHHDVNSEESRAQVKKIWNIFWILLVITVAEVIMGMFFSHSLPKVLVVFMFMVLTLLKAGFIVSVFMHLGDEFRNFIATVLIPLVLFVWFIIAFLADGSYWLHMNNTSPARQTNSVQEASHE